MEKLTTKIYIMFSFVLAGLLFSGYLSATKLFTDSCAFGAQCPIFLGYPACYTGFIVYFILAVASLIALLKQKLSRTLLLVITGFSLFGVLFSAKLTLEEMAVWFSDGFIAFVKSLPLCSVGLLFYVAIFVLSLIIGRNMDREEKEEEEEMVNTNPMTETAVEKKEDMSIGVPPKKDEKREGVGGIEIGSEIK